ncbi:MAG: hypothetical protein COA42_21130 [Alteromonadaceae bacterium]|nr:MAG: hypothetical protein COA42_21130 [Alteromonadaceae bacterium]
MAIASTTLPVLAEVEPGFNTQVTLQASRNNGMDTWLNGGYGRFSHGDDSQSDTAFNGRIDLGYKARFWQNFEISTHLQARQGSGDDERDALGLVTMKLRYVQATAEQQRLMVTLGQFFLPTSMENTDPFWESPYTITYSSMNSWIGEEFRPIGIDLDYRWTLADKQQFKLAATAFQGNDSMGAMLAWRGWSYGNHLSVYGETLALPDLYSLQEPNAFAIQNDSGSTPVTGDFDGDIGFALRGSWRLNSDTQVKLTHVDNNGDKGLHNDPGDGEYAWRTRFTLVGFESAPAPNVTFLGEYMSGSSIMGATPTHVDIDFESLYLLTSLRQNDWRYSLRYDTFSITDRDLLKQDPNWDDGESLTFAVFWQQARSKLSLGAEVLALDSERKRVIVDGTLLQNPRDQLQFSLQARYRL